MATSGYILNGVYHKRADVPLKKMVNTQQSTYKQSDHAKQRFDHSGEILQPYTIDGKPNPKFIEAWPDAAVEYGFIPDTKLPQVKTSDTPHKDDPEYGGSLPWDAPVVYQKNFHRFQGQ